ERRQTPLRRQLLLQVGLLLVDPRPAFLLRRRRRRPGRFRRLVPRLAAATNLGRRRRRWGWRRARRERLLPRQARRRRGLLPRRGRRSGAGGVPSARALEWRLR